MKDMTFQHEGNDNQKQSLVNFEKMVDSQSEHTCALWLHSKIVA